MDPPPNVLAVGETGRASGLRILQKVCPFILGQVCFPWYSSDAQGVDGYPWTPWESWTSTFKLPERNPSKSTHTNLNPSSFR